MIHVLLLRNCATDFETERSTAQLAGLLGPEFSTVAHTLGEGGSLRNLPTAMLDLCWRRKQPADVVHAWGPAALTAAVLMRTGRIIYSPPYRITPRHIRWLNAIFSRQAIDVVCSTVTQHRLLVEHGLPLERCHVIRPGVDFGPLQRRPSREEIRKRMQIDPSRFVILPVGDAVDGAAHRMAAFAAMILNFLDSTYALTVWRRGPLVHLTENLSRQSQPGALVKAPMAMSYERLLAAADVAIVSADAPVPTLPIATTMAAGLPIVARTTDTVCELLEDHHTALMVGDSRARHLADRVIQLRQDPHLRWKLADTARSDAYEFFSQSRYMEQWRQCYRQAAGGKTIQIDQPTTAMAM